MFVIPIHLEISSMIKVSVLARMIVHRERKATQLLIYSLKIGTFKSEGKKQIRLVLSLGLLSLHHGHIPR
jgi:hypothetical protein